MNVFLIYKEIITNILKHSDANFVNIRIFRSNQKTTIIVSDNGKTTITHNTDGIGKLSMEQRAKTILTNWHESKPKMWNAPCSYNMI